MQIRTAALAVALTGVGSLVTVTLSSSSASATTYHPAHVLTLTTDYTDITSTFVGKNANKPSIGDEFVDTSVVRQNGKVIGKLSQVCTMVAGTTDANSLAQCAGVIGLAKGEITTFGTAGGTGNTSAAITGGTGTYADLRGSVETDSGQTSATLIIRYIDQN